MNLRTIIDRCYREWLYPPDDAPMETRITAAVAADATSLKYDPDLLPAEEEEILGPGTRVEVDRELYRVNAINVSTKTLTVTPGILGTASDGHDQNAALVVAPPYPRQVILDAVADAVAALYPRLYGVKTTPLTSAVAPVQAPRDCQSAIFYRWKSGDRWLTTGDVEVLTDFPEVGTRVAVQFPRGVPTAKSGYLTYRARLERPEFETDEFTQLGLRPQWAQLVIVATIAAVAGKVDLNQSTAELVTEVLEAQGVPIGSGESVRTGLLRYRNLLLSDAESQLLNDYPATVEHAEVVVTQW